MCNETIHAFKNIHVISLSLSIYISLYIYACLMVSYEKWWPFKDPLNLILLTLLMVAFLQLRLASREGQTGVGVTWRLVGFFGLARLFAKDLLIKESFGTWYSHEHMMMGSMALLVLGQPLWMIIILDWVPTITTCKRIQPSIRIRY